MNEFLFQRPKSSGKGEVWYNNMVVGDNVLGKKMKAISQQAELSTTYTNHSIRATTITILDRSGFEARYIMLVSGHRKSYSKTDENTKTNMVGSLMAVIDNKKSDTEKVVAFELSKHDQNEELGWVSTKRRPKTQKRRLVFFTGLPNQSQSSWVNAFPQTPTDAKPVGSSFCILSRVKLQNEEPHLNALFIVN